MRSNKLVFGKDKEGKQISYSLDVVRNVIFHGNEDTLDHLLDSLNNKTKIIIVDSTINRLEQLKELNKEMNRRFDTKEKLPQVVCVINHLEDMGEEEKALALLLVQKGSSCGIYCIISADIIRQEALPSLFLANCKSRFIQKVDSEIESFQVLAEPIATELKENEAYVRIGENFPIKCYL